MGKTEKGAIWIDKNKISAYDFYQGIYQIPDACVEMMFALFTDIDMAEVRSQISQDIVSAKKKLAFEITKFIRGEKDAVLAQQTAQEVFAGSGKSDNMNTFKYSKLAQGVNVCELLADVNICSSRGEARRLIAQNGISIDGNKVSDDKMIIKASEIVVSKGKKIHLKVVSE